MTQPAHAIVGSIVRDAATVAAAVEVRLTVSNVPMPNQWSGRFSVAPGTDVKLGPARLSLADGRAGDVVLFRLDAGEERTLVVNFYGIGALKRTAAAAA